LRGTSNRLLGRLTQNLNTYEGEATAGAAGGIVAYATAAGTNQGLSQTPVAFQPTVQATKSTTSNRWAANVPGSWREYGRAIEIINSTAPLYQQGQCIVWRQPMPNPADATTITMVDPAVTNGLPGALTTVRAPAPPESAAEAIALLGSREWHAKEGAYLMNTSNSDENPTINGQYLYALYYNTSYNDNSVWGPQWTNVAHTAETNTQPAFAPSAYQPFNMVGAYFTGLSAQTTLTVSIRSYVEIFPSQIGNTLTSLATPSAPYDERARRLYAECMKTMPPGVMLCENGFGDWLSDVAGKIANFVSPVAKVVGNIARAIPHPLAQLVARGADTAGGIAAQYLAPGSDDVRNDGVAASIQREKRMLKSEARARDQLAVVPTAKFRVGARQAEALEKLKARNRLAAAKKKG